MCYKWEGHHPALTQDTGPAGLICSALVPLCDEAKMLNLNNAGRDDPV